MGTGSSLEGWDGWVKISFLQERERKESYGTVKNKKFDLLVLHFYLSYTILRESWVLIRVNKESLGCLCQLSYPLAHVWTLPSSPGIISIMMTFLPSSLAFHVNFPSYRYDIRTRLQPVRGKVSQPSNSQPPI